MIRQRCRVGCACFARPECQDCGRCPPEKVQLSALGPLGPWLSLRALLAGPGAEIWHDALRASGRRRAVCLARVMSPFFIFFVRWLA